VLASGLAARIRRVKADAARVVERCQPVSSATRTPAPSSSARTRRTTLRSSASSATGGRGTAPSVSAKDWFTAFKTVAQARWASSSASAQGISCGAAPWPASPVGAKAAGCACRRSTGNPKDCQCAISDSAQCASVPGDAPEPATTVTTAAGRWANKASPARPNEAACPAHDTAHCCNTVSREPGATWPASMPARLVMAAASACSTSAARQSGGTACRRLATACAMSTTLPRPWSKPLGSRRCQADAQPCLAQAVRRCMRSAIGCSVSGGQSPPPPVDDGACQATACAHPATVSIAGIQPGQALAQARLARGNTAPTGTTTRASRVFTPTS
jgi:hypothetical protein